MKSFNNFNELNWLLTYKSSNQVWLNDSLNWEKVSAIVTMDWTIPSFITQSTFINNHILFDTITRMSYLDVFLINSNLNLNKTSIFYLNIINDSFLHLITFFLPITPLLHSEYNETFSTTFLVAPELVTLFTDYISIYYFNNTFDKWTWCVILSAITSSITHIFNFIFIQAA